MITINTKLNEDQELILLYLLETGPIPFHNLYMSISLILEREKGLKEFSLYTTNIIYPYRNKQIQVRSSSTTGRTISMMKPEYEKLPTINRTKIEKEIETLINYELVDKKWISKISDKDLLLWEIDKERLLFFEIGLTAKGKEQAIHISKNRQVILKPVKKQITKVFIASQIGDQIVKKLCNDYIADFVKKRNLEPRYITNLDPAFTITDQILQDINEADIIIADLTHARPSVYFEYGWSRGLGLKSILTCNEDHIGNTNDNKKVHFDLLQFRISFWRYEKDSEKFLWKDDDSPEKRLDSILAS